MAPIRALRLDDSTWRRMAASGSLGAAGLMVGGAYLVLAFDRFGVQGFVEPRAIVRFLLTGFYGWLGLTAGAAIIGALAFRHEVAFAHLVRLVGHAHLPLLLIGLAIQFVSVTLDVTGIVLWPALAAVLLWMPAMLVKAVGTGLNVERSQAVVAALVPFTAWVLIVGRALWRQLEHLL